MPLLERFPPPSTYLPLTCLLAAVGTGLAAWVFGRLTPELAAWGNSALEVVQGRTWLPTNSGGHPIPPAYAWALALALSLPVGDTLVLLALPGYLYALATLGFTYGLVRRWYSAGVALWATFLIAFNPLFLEHARVGDSSLGILCWSMLGLWAYVHHLIKEEETFSAWTVVGGIAFAALLLSAGFFAFWLPAAGLLNVLAREWERGDRLPTALRACLTAATARAGFFVVAIGIVFASPWLLRSGWSAGPLAPWAIPVELQARPNGALVELALALRATLILALVGFWRAAREVLRGSEEADRATLPVVWTLVAALTINWTAPTQIGLVSVIIPLSVLAAQTILDILHRRIADRPLAVIVVVACWFYLASGMEMFRDLPGLLAPVVPASSPGAVPAVEESETWFSLPAPLRAEAALALHFAVDVLVLVAAVIYLAYRLSAKQDRLRRLFFGGFVVATVGVVAWPLLTLPREPLRRDNPWSRAQEQLAQLDDIDLVIFVGSEPPSDPLLFVVRSRFRNCPVESAVGRVELESAFAAHGTRPLVLVTDPSQRLPRATPITKGELTVTIAQIFDSDEVIAYAPARR